MRPKRILASALVVVVLGLLFPVGLMYARLYPGRVALDDDPGRHGLRYDPVSFTSPLDGTSLSGWYLPSSHPSGRAVVIAPGIDDNRLAGGITLKLAPSLLAAGYDILAFDLRGEGESGDGPITFGAREQSDIIGAVEEARMRGAQHVAVLGFSLGAASAIVAAAHSPTIDAVIADSAFADLTETLTRELEDEDHVPPPLAAYGLALYRLMSGTDPAEVAPEKDIADIAPRQVLLIHGDADQTVPLGDSQRLLAAAGPIAERWVVPGGRHAECYHADPSGYTARLLAFLASTLP